MNAATRMAFVVALVVVVSMTAPSAALAGGPASVERASGPFGDHVGRMARQINLERGLGSEQVRGVREPLALPGLDRLEGLALADAVLLPSGFSLQEPEGLDPWVENDSNLLLAFGEAMIVQLVPWVNNSFIRKNAEGGRGEPWSRNIGWASWSYNYANGFEWDDNQFLNNQFSHPYHGNLYFNAGRSNGMDYYQSMSFAFLNSWLWEFHGETFQPAINDWIKTSLGGSVIGEMTHRLSQTIVDNTARGGSRTWGEIGSFLVNPVGGFDRAVKGQMARQWQNPADRGTKVRSHFEIGAFGAKEAVSNAAEAPDTPTLFGDDTEFVPFEPAERVRLGTARFDLRYGDAFDRHTKPFDAFETELQLSFGSDVAALSRITIGGWLHMHQYDWSENNKHGFVVMQRYEYFNNEVLQFGAQVFGFGLNSLFRADKSLKVRTSAELELIPLAAIDSPYAEVVNRTYDYGPGAGIRIEARLEEDGFDYLRVRLGSMFVHTVNGGGEGDHNVAYGSIRGMLPLFGRFGIGAEFGYVRRDGFFEDLPDLKRDNDFARLFVTWVTK